MKSILAKELADSANRYKVKYGKAGADLKLIERDYEDLMSIAQLIEDHASAKIIQKAMWQLDTAVRDEIPDKVFWTFNGQ